MAGMEVIAEVCQERRTVYTLKSSTKHQSGSFFLIPAWLDFELDHRRQRLMDAAQCSLDLMSIGCFACV